MFVSSMLKKCVNLLSYDSTKFQDHCNNNNAGDTSYQENDCKINSDLLGDLHGKGEQANDMEYALQAQEDTAMMYLSCLDCTFSESSPASLSSTEDLKKFRKPRPSVLSTFDPLFIQNAEKPIPVEDTDNIFNTKTSENNLPSIREAEPNLTTYNEETDESVFHINTLENTFLHVNEPEPNGITYKMTDLCKIQQLKDENGELKRQLNSSQQLAAKLELQLIEKGEITTRMQREALEKDHAGAQEIKQFKDKLEEKVSDHERTAKELEETIKTMKECEAKLFIESLAFKNNEHNYSRIMGDYEKRISTQLGELHKLNEEHNNIKKHFANLEMAFSDVHQKYERSKSIIGGYKTNEDTLRDALTCTKENLLKSEEKYELLKAHAKAQLERSNQELLVMRDHYEVELNKLITIVKRLEIKLSSLALSLDQKNKECTALSALCDEVTGKR